MYLPMFSQVVLRARVNLIYQADYDIGTAVDGDHDYLENRITAFYDTIYWNWP